MNRGNFSPTPIHEMITTLFAHPKFKSPKIQLALASYPTVQERKKPALVQEVLRQLWPEELKGNFFELFERFESLLIAMGKRDHFLHQFHVFLLGLHAIEIIGAGMENGEERLATFGMQSEDEIFLAWLMTSTTHDFGRPIAEVKKLNEEMSELFRAFGFNSLSDFYGLGDRKPKLRSDFGKISLGQHPTVQYIENTLDLDRLLVKEVSKTLALDKKETEGIVSDRRTQLSHGYLGSIILGLNVIKYGMKAMGNNWDVFEKSPLYRALLPSMAAIFVHDMNETDHWNNLRPENNFFAFLLCLSDQLQEWDRALRPDVKWPDSLLEDFKCDKETRHIRITYNLNHSSWDEIVKKNIQTAFQEKRGTLSKLQPQQTFLNLNITLEYTSNCGISVEIPFAC